MRAISTLVSRKTFFIGCFMLLGFLGKSQLKIGDNPTSIQQSSILELESTRQGLLLPRLADTVAINALTPPDGMIIYLNSDKSLRLRKNGAWVKMANLSDASSNWSLTGNTGTDPLLNFIGTADGQPLIMKTNNAERMRIDADGNIGIGTGNPTAKLNVDGTVKLENLALGTNELEVLVIAADGSVHKRVMSSSAFENAIKAINGLQKQSLSITASASTTEDSVIVKSTAADSTIAIYLPVQDGTSITKPYGMLTYIDWQKIQSTVQTIAIGAVASSPDVNGATIVADSTSRTIILHAADATHPGIVTADAQTFGGDKTFAANVAVNGNLNLNNVAINTTTDSVLVINNGIVEKRAVSASAFGNAIRSINNNRDTAQTIAITNTGSDLTVTANGTDSVFINVPDAGASSRGVVTAIAQTFAGTKTFQDSVTASKAMLVGNAGNANSTMQVDGSLSMSIKTVSADYTATSSDNTILVDATSGAIILTLPNTGAITGRIYTIKKIGTGGIDNKLTIAPSTGTIEGGTSYTIYNDWTFVSLQTDGANWYIIKK